MEKAPLKKFGDKRKFIKKPKLKVGDKVIVYQYRDGRSLWHEVQAVIKKMNDHSAILDISKETKFTQGERDYYNNLICVSYRQIKKA